MAAAGSDRPILITGEVGVGKTFLASYLHTQSVRRNRPIQYVQCGSLGELENQLFGHRAGSFTGAIRDFSGRLRQADGGTLILDDFERLSHRHQDQLHRVLIDGEFYPLGADQPFRVDVRVIATTNKPVQREIEEGRLKADFVNRLDYFTFHVPPLRERPNDIPELAEELLRRNLEELARKGVRTATPLVFDDDCWPMLQAREYPGNIRDLDKLVVRLIAWLGPRGMILPSDIEAVWPALGRERRPLFDQPESLRKVRDAAERDYILKICERTGFNLRGAARILGVSPKCLYEKLSRYGIARP
jgi:DNA-binding NtrC family response regulator